MLARQFYHADGKLLDRKQSGVLYEFMIHGKVHQRDDSRQKKTTMKTATDMSEN